jgi:hypothetical protein
VNFILYLFEDEHGGGLIDVADVLFPICAEAHSGYIGEQFPVFFAEPLLAELQGAQDAVEIDNA